MATDNSSYFSNAYPGHTTLFDGNIYQKTAKPKYQLGFLVTRADGARYRYAQYGAATNRGVLVSQDISETGQVDTDNGMVAPASAVTTTDGTIGSYFIEITKDGIIANQYAGGYLTTNDDVGEGYTYRIKGNTASGNPTGTNFRLELYEPLQVAVDATTDYSVIGLPWNNIEIATRTTDSILSGVSCNTSTAALPFGFVQTCGIVTVLQDIHVPAIGDPVCLSSLISGAVQKYFGTGSVGETDAPVEGNNYVIGFCVDPGDSTGHTPIFLNLPW